MRKPFMPLLLTFFLSIMLSSCNQPNYMQFSGAVRSDQIDAFSEVAGKVIKIEKEEGSSVKKGDILASLDSGMQELVVKQQEALIKLKKARLEELKAGARPEQIQQAEAAFKSASVAVNNAQTGVSSSNISYNYWLEKYNNTKSLYSSDTVTENDLTDVKYKLDSAQQQLASAQMQLQASKSQLESSQSQLNLLKNGATSQAIQASEAELEQSNAMLDQAKLALSKYKIISPTDGTLIQNNIDEGSIINTGSSAGTVSDLTNLWINIYVQQKYLHLISIGQEIELRSKALDNTSIKGKVSFIASEAEFTPRNIETDDAKENTVFKVKISILDKINELKPGMTIDVIIPFSARR